MKKVYRLIEYCIPDEHDEGMDEIIAGHAQGWLDMTLEKSIDGRFELPNGFTITAVQIDASLVPEDLVAQLDHGRKWVPPQAEARAKSRGDL